MGAYIHIKWEKRVRCTESEPECMYLQPWVQVDQGHYNANVHDVEKEKQNGFVYVHLQRCGVCMWGRRGQFIHLNAGSAKIRGFGWWSIAADDVAFTHAHCHQLPLPQPLPRQWCTRLCHEQSQKHLQIQRFMEHCGLVWATAQRRHKQCLHT